MGEPVLLFFLDVVADLFDEHGHRERLLDCLVVLPQQRDRIHVPPSAQVWMRQLAPSWASACSSSNQ
ncbi:hypothetical protein ACFXJJ_12360 [Streptomyces sp. NPDC059233]